MDNISKKQFKDLYNRCKNLLLSWRYIEVAKRTQNAVLLATDTEDELKAILEKIDGAYSVQHVDMVFESLKQSIEDIDRSLTQKRPTLSSEDES